MNNFSPSEPDLTLMDDQSDASMDHHRITPKHDSKPESKASVAKQLIFSEGSGDSSSSKGVVIKETALNEVIAQAGKLGNNAAVLMPGNYLLPVNLLKSGRQIAILTSASGSKILAALPGTSNSKSPVQLASPIKEQMSLQEFKRLANDQTTAGNAKGGNKNEPQQVLCLRTLPNNATQLILSPTEQKTPVVRNELESQAGTAIIISSPKGKKRYLINDPELLAKLTKGGELSSTDVKKLIELQETSPVVTTTTTSVNQVQTPHIQSKVVQMHKHINSNGEVVEESDRNELSTQYHGKIIRSDRKIVEVMNQRNSHNQQAALERELRLQKSLSEECEDLGVDEPEDLFPEAGLLFDSLDPSSQEHGMGIDTPKVDKLTPIFFAEEKKTKVLNHPKQEDSKIENVKKEIKTEDSTLFTSVTFSDDLGASTEVKTEEQKSKEDMYEFNTDEKSSDDNTDTEYNRFLHKKLGRVNNQPPMFSYKRKRSSNVTTSPTLPAKKKVKNSEKSENPNDQETEDIETVINTNVVQSVGATLIVSTEKPVSPHTRRASTRGHVKKNCPCCKPKKNSSHIHTHESPPAPPIPSTPSPVMTRKLRASIGSPSGSSTHSSSSPSTSSSLGGGQNTEVNVTAPLERTRGRNRNTTSNKQPTSKLSKRR